MVLAFPIQVQQLQARIDMAKTRKEQPKPLSRKSKLKRKKIADSNLKVLSKLLKK